MEELDVTLEPAPVITPGYLTDVITCADERFLISARGHDATCSLMRSASRLRFAMIAFRSVWRNT